MTLLNNFFSLMMLAACLLFLWDAKKGKLAGLAQEKAPARWHFLAAAALLIGLRCYAFGSVPGGFNQDGAMASVEALALANHGTDRFGTWLPAHFEAWKWAQMNVLLSYFMVPFIKLFGFNPVSLRMPILFWSILGAFALAGVAEKLISRKAALITLLFTAIAPWHFMQSRWALEANMFPHMFIIGLYFLCCGLEKKLFIYISMVFFGLSMYSYGVTFYMVPFFLLGACILLAVHKKVGWKEILISILIYFGISFPIYGTMFLNFMGWPTVKLPFVTMQLFQDTTRDKDILFFSDNPFKQFKINLVYLLRIPFLQKPDLYWNEMNGFGTIYLCSLPLLLLGIGISAYQAVKNSSENKRILFTLIIGYWLVCLFMGISINYININRMNVIFYVHILFIAIALYHIITARPKLTYAFAAVYLILTVLFLNTYYTTWADNIKVLFNEDYHQAVACARDLDADYYYITPNVQFEGATDTSEILTMFQFQVDAEYYQGKTNEMNGKNIPYADRFHYEVPAPEAVKDDSSTVCVVDDDFLAPFRTPDFRITDFGRYHVVVPAAFG